MTVPHILEEIVALPDHEWTEVLRPLQFVACGGGPLKLSVGEKLANSGVRILARKSCVDCSVIPFSMGLSRVKVVIAIL